LVLDEPERMKAVRNFFSPRASEALRSEILRRYAVTHVLIHRKRQRHLTEFLDTRGTRRSVPAGYFLYSLTPASLEL
jgi:hypothetical protein